MKLVYFTDPHVRGTNPRARVDDYPAAITLKLAEVFRLAERCQAAAIVCGGDLFDRPDPSPAVVIGFAELFRQCPVPVYVCPGNHDLFGYSPETLPRTMLGLLDALGVVHVLDEEWLVDGEVRVRLTGCAFYADLDLPSTRGRDYNPPPVGPAEPHVSIHVVHGMLVERPLPARHTLLKEVQTRADVILSGHEHVGYGARRLGRTLFVHPGALGRVAAKIEELHRPVRVAVLDVTEAGVEVELVPLKSARPGEEVLSREHLVRAAAKEEKVREFLGLLQEAGDHRFLGIREIIDGIARQDGLPPAVVREALDRLGRVREVGTA